MRRVVSFLTVLFLLAVGLPSATSQGVRDNPDLPGPFQPYNVTGKYGRTVKTENDKSIKVPGNFHCLITEHGLDPGVLIFVRGVKGQLPKSDAEAEKKKGTDEKDDMLGVEAGKLLKELVARLENVADKNPAVRLETYVIFHGDKPLKDVVRMDDERE